MQRIAGSKDLDVAFDFARVEPNSDRPQRASFAGCRRDPDPVFADDGRGPAEPFDGRLPDDARLFAPFDREAGLVRSTLTVGPAELRPLFTACGCREQEGQRRCSESGRKSEKESRLCRPLVQSHQRTLSLPVRDCRSVLVVLRFRGSLAAQF